MIRLRSHSLYVSYDAGQTFEKLMQPENVMIHDSKMNGLVASRYDYDGTYLYVTMNVTEDGIMWSTLDIAVIPGM